MFAARLKKPGFRLNQISHPGFGLRVYQDLAISSMGWELIVLLPARQNTVPLIRYGRIE